MLEGSGPALTSGPRGEGRTMQVHVGGVSLEESTLYIRRSASVGEARDGSMLWYVVGSARIVSA